METDFPEIDDEVAGDADAWRNAVFVPHAMTSSDLERMTAAFLACGGAIQKLDVGERADITPIFNGHFPGLGTAMERAVHEKACRKVASAHLKNDPHWQQQLDVLIAMKCSRAETAKQIGISDHTLQRLLRTYYQLNADADYLRAGYVERKQSHTCPKCQVEKPISEFYKNATMFSGHASACKACEAASRRVRREQPSAA
ncbi:hypothetical protein [Pseudomonas nitroreducens]|uniref:hypothetical protein n=1 Tax=Pseudomonas nitroreducens TaxID=46680 RepID=UPI00351D21B0